jgi:hypothetical protein
MSRRLESLRGELDAALNRVIELHFERASDARYSAISTSVLSQILGRLQSTLTFGTWAQRSGPQVIGTPPTSIERAARTEVVATPPGSFRVVVRKEELELAPEFDQSVQVVFDLAEAAAHDALNDDFGEKAQALGREGTRRLELLFKKLADEDLHTELLWNSPAESREVLVTSDVAAQLSKWLAQMTPSIEQVTVEGYLRRADTLSGAFKIEATATGRIVEGSGDPEVLAHAEMDALYIADIEHETRTSPHSGRVTERFTLTALRSTATHPNQT